MGLFDVGSCGKLVGLGGRLDIGLGGRVDDGGGLCRLLEEDWFRGGFTGGGRSFGGGPTGGGGCCGAGSTGGGGLSHMEAEGVRLAWVLEGEVLCTLGPLST